MGKSPSKYPEGSQGACERAVLRCRSVQLPSSYAASARVPSLQRVSVGGSASTPVAFGPVAVSASTRGGLTVAPAVPQPHPCQGLHLGGCPWRPAGRVGTVRFNAWTQLGRVAPWRSPHPAATPKCSSMFGGAVASTGAPCTRPRWARFGRPLHSVPAPECCRCPGKQKFSGG